jgi:CubicO group peptidase (beta-lactamase class C family)
MTLGTEWNEDLPYTDPANSEIAMERSWDRYRFILDQPIVAEPGERWIYCGGATALLGHLIAKGSGRKLLTFAREQLFAPLGIQVAEWVNGTNGEAAAASGLRLRPRDLARIGQMLIDNGQWEGRQVVPADWLEQTFQPLVVADEFRRYGYHWYMGEFPVGTGRDARKERWVGAFGNGGQRLFVLPGIRLAIAITAGNYNMPDQWKPPIIAVRQFILPSLRAL